MPQARTVKIWVGIVFAVSILPVLLQWGGQSFATLSVSLDINTAGDLSPEDLNDALHYALAGSLVHTVLEWSAFGAATLTAGLAFLHFAIHHDWITPVIGLMLFYAGCMDAFHILAADRLLLSVASTAELTPFTWTLGRTFTACILIVGILAIQRSYRQTLAQQLTGRRSILLLASLAVVFSLVAYGIAWAGLNTKTMPKMIFTEGLITRPWDLLPLGLFAILGLGILPKFHRVHRNYFSLALWVSTIPQMATQLHMAFGSIELFDTDFNAAHFLKIVAYLVPFSGLCLSYIRANQERTIALEQLQVANQSLIQLEQVANDRAEELNQVLVNLRQTQSQLIHAEKMSGLDRLVAGIAHEINNPVSFIGGNLRYAKNYMQDLIQLLEAYQATWPDRPTSLQELEHKIDLPFLQLDFPKLMDSIQRGADRISTIVSALRSFSGLDEQGVKPLNLQLGLQHALLMLSHRLDPQRPARSNPNHAAASLSELPSEFPSIMVETHYEADVPEILCYPNQMNQVLLHLLTNAIDALDEALQGGRLEREPGWQPKLYLGLTALGDQVQIMIRDNGVGIPAAVQDRLFDPFFTTKPVGQGAGLGLAVSERIIKAHGGMIVFCSTCDRGTEFQVKLPRQPDSDGV
ncbi:MAG TPA: ATP-binding protein, partial [Coleofasciculaceae cyanobacterium]